MSQAKIYIMYKRKNFGKKSQELTNLKCSKDFLPVRDVSRESTTRVQMPIHSNKFFKNVVKNKLTEHGKT